MNIHTQTDQESRTSHNTWIAHIYKKNDRNRVEKEGNGEEFRKNKRWWKSLVMGTREVMRVYIELVVALPHSVSHELEFENDTCEILDQSRGTY